MQATFVILLFAISAVLAYPSSYEFDEPQEGPDYYADADVALSRVRRQLNVQGGGSPGKGIDLSVQGRAPVWQSNNGRHSFDVTGQYGQHFGGPYGNSRPSWGAGGAYTFRF
ncbi:diptericin A-like [Scaptodrosophila lebanonensis]|uniref:Diptericin A-like n=1 Tax=Drosophila lebanonensis TaxID=7225 RepID=A0A6J2UFN5_DROLE|nr:diptericin A-like [Scaptodrosophila lebanonensis]